MQQQGRQLTIIIAVVDVCFPGHLYGLVVAAALVEHLQLFGLPGLALALGQDLAAAHVDDELGWVAQPVVEVAWKE